jgi:ankyrin repeat protein
VIPPGALPYRAALEEYEQAADALLAALRAGEREAAWRFKWMHRRFHGRSVSEVGETQLGPDDARLVVAQEHGFTDWDRLAAFAHAVNADPDVRRFETAVEAVVSGDLPVLRSMLREHPDLVAARSSRRHRATLLHYVGANGVENGRQRTPQNAVEVCRLLLDAGASVDALADMYGARCTTLSMLVSSSPPAETGLQTALAETLLDHGAALEGPGSQWTSAVLTALTFGFGDTADALARRGGVLERLAVAAGLGRLEDARRLLRAADAGERHAALALAAAHGHPETLQLLLDAGEDPDRFNPEGFHSHSMPLHQAVWGDHMNAVRMLVEAGARLDLRDQIFDGTPLGWALHGGRERMVEYLRAQGAPE